MCMALAAMLMASACGGSEADSVSAVREPAATPVPATEPDPTATAEPTATPEPEPLVGELLLQRGTTRLPSQAIVHDLASGVERALTQEGVAIATGEWTSDGSRLVYAISEGVTRVVVAEADGANPVQASVPVADVGWEEAVPTWAPDCQRLAFARFDLENNRSEIWTMLADGTDRVQVTSGTGIDTGVDWSPVDDRLVFMSDRGGDSEIVVIDMATGEESQLTDNTVGDTWPQWSPDGDRIAFARRVNERKQIFVVDADGTNEVQLTNGARGGEFPVWSSDGDWIAYEQAGVSVSVMRADGTDRRELDISGVPTDWGPNTGTCS